MSNLKNYTGYIPWLKKQMRAFFKGIFLVIQWFKKISFAVVAVSFAVIFYQAINLDIMANLNPKNAQVSITKPNQDSSASTRNIQTKVTNNLDQVNIEKTILKKESDKKDPKEKLSESMQNNIIMASIINDTSTFNSDLSENPIKNILIEPNKNKIINKAKNEINFKAQKGQSIQIARIVKQMATDKMIIPNTLTNTKTAIKSEITVKTNQAKIEVTLSSGFKPQSNDGIKNTQDVLQKDLNQLFNDAELEDILKKNYSMYLNN